MFALLSLILLIPVIIFLPIGINWKGKAAVTVSALFISLVGLAATSVFPLWESLLISLLLFMCVIYMIGKRSDRFLTAADDADDDYYYAAHTEVEPKSAITKVNDVFVIESEKPAFRDKGPEIDMDTQEKGQEQDRAELPEELLTELQYAAAKDIDLAEGIEEKEGTEIKEDSSFLEQRELLWDDLEVSEEVQEHETDVNLSEIEMMLEHGDSEGTISLEKAEPEEVLEPETALNLNEIEMMLQDGDSMETLTLEKAENAKGLSQEEYEFLLENPGESIEELEMDGWSDTSKDDRDKEEEAETAANDWLELLESEEYVIVPMDEEIQDADINSGSELNSETLEIEVPLEETNDETSIEEMEEVHLPEASLEENPLLESEELKEQENELESSQLIIESAYVKNVDKDSADSIETMDITGAISESVEVMESSHWGDLIETDRDEQDTEEIADIQEKAEVAEEPDNDNELFYMHVDEEIEDTKKDMIESNVTQLQQQMFQTLIDQIELARSTYSSSQFEELVKSHLNPDLLILNITRSQAFWLITISKKAIGLG